MAMNWSSFGTRKVVLGSAAVAIVTATWVATQWLPLAGEHYGTLVAGIGALYATFSGASTVQDHIFKNKAPVSAGEARKPPVEPLPE